ncbi:MAG TPA: hypothetical protein VMU33_00860 [Burkholderiaceae bacterium]|nr:hypothetical protein [Burkholderiaceae bacterium]
MARVFRGDASVNKALRLVIALTQVVEGPASARSPAAGRTALRAPHERDTAPGAGASADRPPRRSRYEGSPEARGFTRKPRPQDEDTE